MRRLLWAQLILFSFGVCLSIAQAEIVLNTEAEQLRQNLESKLQRTMETYLGERSKVLVGLQLNLTPENTGLLPKASDTPEKLEAVGDELWVDLGYVSTPGDIPVKDPTADSRSTPARKLSLESVDAEVRVSDSLDAPTLQEVERLAVATLQTLNPTVRVLKVSFPVPPAKVETASKPPEEPKKEEPARTPAADAAESPDAFDRVVKKYGPLIPLLASLMVGLGILLAAILSSRMLSESAGEIAQGIRSIKSAFTAAVERKPTTPELNENELAERKPPKAPPVSPRLREHARNLSLIKQMLGDNPLPFVRSLKDTALDRKGLRWLLANLSLDERGLLKNFLGPERIATLSAPSEDAGTEPPFDASSWLQEVIEGLVVREVSGVSLIERSLSTPQVLRLSTANPEELYRLAERLNDASVWRVTLEFLSKERILSAMKSNDASLLQKVIAAGDPSSESLQQAALRLIRELGEPKGQEVSASTAADDRKRFYSNILLEPAVDSVLAKALGEDDEFLDELSKMAPDFVELLRRKVWTPRSLLRVADGDLKEAFAPLSPAQKTALMLALPAEYSQRLERFLPEGTGRTVVLDQLRRARDRSEMSEFEAASRLAREFLDFLRRQVEAGKMALEESRGFGERGEDSRATKVA